MTAAHIIRREHGPHGGRYLIDHPGGQAILSYRVEEAGILAADHTIVPDGLRGTGAGLALLARMVEDARAEAFRIRPLCPFVKAQQEKHPEWADAFV